MSRDLPSVMFADAEQPNNWQAVKFIGKVYKILIFFYGGQLLILPSN